MNQVEVLGHLLGKHLNGIGKDRRCVEGADGYEHLRFVIEIDKMLTRKLIDIRVEEIDVNARPYNMVFGRWNDLAQRLAHRWRFTAYHISQCEVVGDVTYRESSSFLVPRKLIDGHNRRNRTTDWDHSGRL